MALGSQGSGSKSEATLEHHPSVVKKLRDGLLNVEQCVVLGPARLFEAGVRIPKLTENLEATDVDHPVVKVATQGRHVAVDELAVRADGVSAQDGLIRTPSCDAAHEFSLGVSDRNIRSTGACKQAVLFVHAANERHHAGKLFFGLPDVHAVRLQRPQLLVRDDQRCLQNDLGLSIEAGHFEIDPDQVVGMRRARER